MIDSKIKQEILRRLKKTEQERQVKILYACESGSRAWGFASSDSDYDVRFIYVHPQDWYLQFNIERRRDVIEYPIVDEIDCSGWDVRKALYLYTRTNGALLEWLHSPIVYMEQGQLAQQLRDYAPEAFSEVALCYHYHHMAKGNFRQYLQGEQIRLKKYLYVIRPLLAIAFIQAYHVPPPVEFEELVRRMTSGQVQEAIGKLLELKRQSPELGLGGPIPVIDQFIKAQFERLGDSFTGQGRPDLLNKQAIVDTLNEFFRESIQN